VAGPLQGVGRRDRRTVHLGPAHRGVVSKARKRLKAIAHSAFRRRRQRRLVIGGMLIRLGLMAMVASSTSRVGSRLFSFFFFFSGFFFFNARPKYLPETSASRPSYDSEATIHIAIGMYSIGYGFVRAGRTAVRTKGTLP